MKKILLVLSLLFVFTLANAQYSTGQDESIRCSDSDTLLGSTTDTLVESDTLTYIVRVKCDDVMDIASALEVHKSSGTVTNTWTIYGAFDVTTSPITTNWDSVGTYGLSDAADGLFTYEDLDDFNYPYLIFQAISGATAQSAFYTIWYSIRRE